MFNSEIVTRDAMAKTDSFFIRGKIAYNGSTYAETTIDLGSFVDALGKSVLRVHNVDVEWNSGGFQLTPAANTDYASKFQLTTQSQTAILGVDNKSVIASGHLSAGSDANSVMQMINESVDVGPQHWRNGYLVGVESIYLGVDQNADFGMVACAIVLECTVETLTEKASMALALSQQ